MSKKFITQTEHDELLQEFMEKAKGLGKTGEEAVGLGKAMLATHLATEGLEVKKDATDVYQRRLHQIILGDLHLDDAVEQYVADFIADGGTKLRQAHFSSFLAEQMKAHFLVSKDGALYKYNEYGIPERMLTSAKNELSLAQAISDLLNGYRVVDGGDLNFRTKVADDVIERLRASELRPNSVIQFHDCYVKEGEVIKGSFSQDEPESIQAFYIKRKMYHVYETRNVRAHSEEVDDLLLHLAGGYEDAAEYFTYALSILHLNSPNLKAHFGPKTISLIGPQGGEGKSTLLKLLRRAYMPDDKTQDEKIVVEAKFDQLDNEYNVADIAGALIAMDGDTNEQALSHSASALVKLITDGGNLTVRQIYGTPYEIQATALLISASNTQRKTFDKSGGMERRQEWFYPVGRLQRENEWFTNLNSEESAQYMAELLFLRFLELKELGSFPERPASLEASREAAVDNNNTAKAFIRSVPVTAIAGRLHGDVHKAYEYWCEESGLRPLSAARLKEEISLAYSGLSYAKIQAPKLNPYQLLSGDAEELLVYINSSYIRAADERRKSREAAQQGKHYVADTENVLSRANGWRIENDFVEEYGFEKEGNSLRAVKVIEFTDVHPPKPNNVTPMRRAQA